MDKTLIVTNDYPPRPGGIQTFLHNLVSRLDPEQVVVYAPQWKGDKGGSTVVEWDSQQPYTIYRDPTANMLPTPWVAHRAAQLVRREKVKNVVFGASAPLGLFGNHMRRAGATNIVAMSHGHEGGWARFPGLNAVVKRCGEQADTLTYLGEYTRSRIASVLSPEAAARMVQLPPGVDVKTFHPDSGGAEVRARLGLADRPVVVCVSRLVERKGQDTLIRALPRIRTAVPDAALLIVGPGAYEGKLRELARRMRLEDHVVITGGVPEAELPAYYGAGDVFAMPCRTREMGLDVEGLGIVYLEASATGLPVVAGASGGAPDAVIPGETGYVVDGKSVRHVADRVAELLLDPELRRRMGEAGRAWVEAQWRWETIAERLRDLL
ncbi:alpha-(1-2)-phosphatidylinositol mannosyltransferase [Mangrovactinospora gilvigrisea]|uniref:Alpha-(1-2)-phosphatidylinositol mannosyltransferase n=1 Tax=Mangrovactinospora gilvigrisea TaxID=1428644 RepID=A0A1J7C7I1_9ACTN|nr:glycosyltransferase family 4 protein [Mangrovactinospora gilvigrisea]OIV35610.1 alpha-(1-2)-phosphatidylinositol mannosyltransferase [Mangrovactinospora gilvigrisea]